ncbi:MAG: 23S rRNA (adenine(2030)-N(6))-methyltransferase RlmJ [Magnetospirillum sp. WYHS-4]
MNYRHAFHAGNFADVLKHAVLALLIERLKEKDKPFAVLDTHGGLGLYDLFAAEALKTGEAESGIRRLLAHPAPHPALAPYLAAVASANEGGDGPPRFYPGSPRLVRALLRPGDRLTVCELHPVDAATLTAEFRGDPQVRVREGDGWTEIRAQLPPAERRGLALVDPPFEAPGEFQRLHRALREGHRRFATGQFLLWYPIKDRREVEAFHRDLRAGDIRRILAVELRVRSDKDVTVLSGSGLVLVNPPWKMEEALAGLLPWLAEALAQEPGGGFRLDWLVPE